MQKHPHTLTHTYCVRIFGDEFLHCTVFCIVTSASPHSTLVSVDSQIEKRVFRAIFKKRNMTNQTVNE